MPSLSPLLFQLGFTLILFPHWLCDDVFDPAFAANLAGDAMRRGKEKDLRRVMSRRGFILAGATVSMTGFLAARLYYLQVAQTRRYRRNCQIETSLTCGLCRRYVADCLTAKCGWWRATPSRFELRITPLYADDLKETLKLLATIVDLPELRQEYVLDMAKTLASFREIMVRDDLSQRELARLAVRSALLPGVSFGKSLRRIYPQGALTCHVTGYVSSVTQREIEKDETLEILPNIRYWKNRS